MTHQPPDLRQQTLDRIEDLQHQLAHDDLAAQTRTSVASELEFMQGRLAGMAAATTAIIHSAGDRLTRRQWDALVAAERSLYDRALNGYTDVNEYEDQSPDVAALWDWAALHVDGSTDLQPTQAIEEIARRAAMALAVLAFGTDMGAFQGRL